MRKISSSGILWLQGHEGLRLSAYQDQGGTWTIGFGHTLGVYPGMKISRDQATKFLASDLTSAENDLSRSLDPGAYNGLNQNQVDSLISFIYNVGGPSFKASTMARYINGKESTEVVANEFLRWNKVAGEVNQGIINRRIKEKAKYLEQSSNYVFILVSLLLLIKSKVLRF
jgi:GH24 family phage-related lysozyme (muramidase)